MSEGLTSMISIIVVMVFLFIVFRKKVLPLFGKKTGTAPVTAAPSGDAGKACCDVLVFDISGYPNLSDLSESITLRLTQKISYVEMKGTLTSLSYLSAGTLFFAVVRWRMNE